MGGQNVGISLGKAWILEPRMLWGNSSLCNQGPICCTDPGLYVTTVIYANLIIYAVPSPPRGSCSRDSFAKRRHFLITQFSSAGLVVLATLVVYVTLVIYAYFIIYAVRNPPRESCSRNRFAKRRLLFNQPFFVRWSRSSRPRPKKTLNEQL